MANATVIAVPNTVSPVSITISTTNIAVAFPSITTTRVSTGNVPTTASLIAGAGGGGDMVTVAGLSVSSGGDGSTVSFSVAGDTTSAYVVELAPPGGAGTADTAGNNSSALPSSTSSLILTSQPLSGSGRLAIVLSQAPSDLIAGAISLSVNYN